ncbi:hypothetical protein [Novosphingobium sediminicola]|uniref:Uncharacterized protein n=1 Tax=Novosphingobium sediminicola TaxID=563162 RepID=A0A7W6CIC8_9SPHN|nr:hypothetical protein [Novosphingobium sediminicola]MBB3957108.1 hypothetical protein [Novosphingobium sediminicola]
MRATKSRAYKLQLSEEGIQLFLRCHCRLCRLAGDLLPYGMTLLVAVALLHECDAEVQADEVLDPELERYGGRIIRYVGTTSALSGLVGAIGGNIEQTGRIYPIPPVWKLFLAALVHMESARPERLAGCWRERLDLTV